MARLPFVRFNSHDGSKKAHKGSPKGTPKNSPKLEPHVAASMNMSVESPPVVCGCNFHWPAPAQRA
jgi:hypothetical protein